VEDRVAWGEEVEETDEVAAAELERLALRVALLLELEEEVPRADRVTEDETLAEAAEELEACAEPLGTLAVGAADTVAEMVSVSDTRLAMGEPVATPLLAAVCVGSAVPRTLPVATVLALGVEEVERAALRVTEGDAVAVPLLLRLPVPLKVSAAVRLAVAAALNV
jgi:hypothetical protein